MNSPTTQTASQTFRCPTCGARQEPSPQCRRCKCDLSLVTAVVRRRDELHRQCLRHIRAARFAEALTAAGERWEISPDDDGRRLLGVCNLLMQQYEAAVDYQAADL